jgi:hypothetical protein
MTGLQPRNPRHALRAFYRPTEKFTILLRNYLQKSQENLMSTNGTLNECEKRLPFFSNAGSACKPIPIPLRL